MHALPYAHKVVPSDVGRRSVWALCMGTGMVRRCNSTATASGLLMFFLVTTPVDVGPMACPGFQIAVSVEAVGVGASSSSESDMPHDCTRRRAFCALRTLITGARTQSVSR